MALAKAQKQKVLDDLNEKIESQKSMAFIDLKGIKVKDLSDLRKKIKQASGQLKVAKKTLIKLALEKSNFKLEKDLEGEIAIVFAFEDPFSPLKKVYNFSQSNENLKILAGIFDKKFIEREEIIALAQLPSREELLAKLVGSLSSSISGFVNVLRGNLRGFVYVLSQKVNQ